VKLTAVDRALAYLDKLMPGVAVYFTNDELAVWVLLRTGRGPYDEYQPRWAAALERVTREWEAGTLRLPEEPSTESSWKRRT